MLHESVKVPSSEEVEIGVIRLPPSKYDVQVEAAGARLELTATMGYTIGRMTITMENSGIRLDGLGYEESRW